jgi:hypothetical protein
MTRTPPPNDPEEDKPVVLMPKDKFIQQCIARAEIMPQEQDETLVMLAHLTYLSDQDIQAKICNLMPILSLPNDIVKMDGLP